MESKLTILTFYEFTSQIDVFNNWKCSIVFVKILLKDKQINIFIEKVIEKLLKALLETKCWVQKVAWLNWPV